MVGMEFLFVVGACSLVLIGDVGQMDRGGHAGGKQFAVLAGRAREGRDAGGPGERTDGWSRIWHVLVEPHPRGH